MPDSVPVRGISGVELRFQMVPVLRASTPLSLYLCRSLVIGHRNELPVHGWVRTNYLRIKAGWGCWGRTSFTGFRDPGTKPLYQPPIFGSLPTRSEAQSSSLLVISTHSVEISLEQ